MLACVAWASDATDRAARLAREARKAQDSGQLVRAYILYGEALAADPRNASYRESRDLLAPVAQVLSKAQIEEAATSIAPEPISEPNPFIPKEELMDEAKALQPLPHVRAKDTLADFDIRADSKQLFSDIASIFGVQIVFDRDFKSETIQFTLEKADFRLALEGLTAATGTFVFPISTHAIYVAPDTPAKRIEVEPDVLITLDIAPAMNAQALVEAAGAVKSALSLQHIAWDTTNREVIIMDKASRAHVARSLLESLLLPKGQVRIEVEIFTIDREVNYHYGLSLPTSYQIWDLGHLGGFQTILPTSSTAMTFLAFGSGVGPAYFGVSLASATLFGTFSNSFAKNVYDANVVVEDGQTANFHVGDKYPIPTSIYSGYQQSSSASLYNPIGQVNLEDLGLVLKLTPRIQSAGDVAMDIEADYKTLGTATIDTIPEINERAFKGNVRMAQDQWAVLAGLDETSHSTTRSGFIGLAQIPGLDQVLSENTRDTQTANTLVVIKPVITILPMVSAVGPQFLLGPTKGARVVL